MATETGVDVVMPQMGVSVSEGTITKWLKAEGEAVAADEALLEISTDKVDTEVPSPATGVVRQILAQEGETVAVGTKIAVIGREGAGDGAPPAAEGPPEPATAEAAAEVDAAAEAPVPTAERVEEARPAPAEERETVEAATSAPDQAGDGRAETRFVSPVVARIAAEHGVDVSQVEGTGRGGRVTKKDILSFIEGGGAAPRREPPAEAAPAAPAEPPPAPAPA
ncbi:MAG: E3 binding domain-containing protein, partial [Actinomycetota bacterium]|nr:E3 binding domain-containing protein [Actinomycetota bacterium]